MTARLKENVALGIIDKALADRDRFAEGTLRLTLKYTKNTDRFEIFCGEHQTIFSIAYMQIANSDTGGLECCDTEPHRKLSIDEVRRRVTEMGLTIDEATFKFTKTDEPMIGVFYEDTTRCLIPLNQLASTARRNGGIVPLKTVKKSVEQLWLNWFCWLASGDDHLVCFKPAWLGGRKEYDGFNTVTGHIWEYGVKRYHPKVDKLKESKALENNFNYKVFSNDIFKKGLIEAAKTIISWDSADNSVKIEKVVSYLTDLKTNDILGVKFRDWCKSQGYFTSSRQRELDLIENLKAGHLPKVSARSDYSFLWYRCNKDSNYFDKEIADLAAKLGFISIEQKVLNRKTIVLGKLKSGALPKAGTPDYDFVSKRCRDSGPYSKIFDAEILAAVIYARSLNKTGGYSDRTIQE